PNDSMTAFIFKQAIGVNVLLEGNAYAYIDRDGMGRPVALLWLDPTPGRMTVTRVDGELWYVYRTPGTGELRRLPAADVLHIKGMGFDGLQGYPVLKIHREAVGGAIAARDFSGRYFLNNTQPAGALSHPGKLTDMARTRMRDSWERIHKGFENSHKVAILEEGTSYTPFGSNARESQLLESREFDAREVANIFGVPTHKLGDPS